MYPARTGEISNQSGTCPTVDTLWFPSISDPSESSRRYARGCAYCWGKGISLCLSAKFGLRHSSSDSNCHVRLLLSPLNITQLIYISSGGMRKGRVIGVRAHSADNSNQTDKAQRIWNKCATNRSICEIFLYVASLSSSVCSMSTESNTWLYECATLQIHSPLLYNPRRERLIRNAPKIAPPNSFKSVHKT